MDRHAFLYKLQQKGLTGEWLPFQQSKYIQEILHGGLPSKSEYAAGVCSALCRYVLLEWFKDGIDGDPVGRLARDSVAEMVLALVHEGEDVTSFKKTLSAANKRCISERYFMGFRQALEHTTGTGFSLFALGGITGDGHAIICNGSQNAIFDPNVGYIKAETTSNYMWCFQAIVKEFYPEYLGGGRAVQVYEFA